MKKLPHVFLLFFLAGMIAAGCSKGTENSESGAASGTQTPSKPLVSSGKAESGASGTLTANPNPVKVCDGSGSGITTLTWSVTGAAYVEVRVNSPNGALLAYGGPSGSAATGKWVGKNTVFYLQDVSENKPRTSANTITTITVNPTTDGCP